MTENYKDRVMEFNNESIVLTDPCYIMPDKTSDPEDIEPWQKTDFGERMERVGYTKFITVRNGYGDGEWLVKNKKGDEKIGEIWADSGQTGVYLLDEVNKICPEFIDRRVGKSAAILRGFTGTIKFRFREVKDEFEGRVWTDHVLVIEGVGKIAGSLDVEFLVDFDQLYDETE